MLKKYSFFDGETIEFDDSRSVRELLERAFDEFGYYEPFGMETVTLFQSLHSSGSTGWFTTDPEKSCAEEIENGDDLHFAYHKPGVFYYAEGGWGHHMQALGNHPELEEPVALRLQFDDFKNTVVFSGKLTLRKVIEMFREADYISADADKVTVRAINPYQEPYEIAFSDPRLDLDLVSFEKTLPDAVTTLEIE